MAAFDFDALRDQVRDASDIVEVIGSYVTLKMAGNLFKACCPFHKEKTPSFTVSAERQSFHCFGCGKGGDVYRFIMEYEHVDFMTALRMLAERAHITVPERNTFNGAQSTQSADRKDRLYSLLAQSAAFYQIELKRNPNSVVGIYLATRELPPPIVEKFQIGASPDSWEALTSFLRTQGFHDDEMIAAGVSAESKRFPGRIYDVFRNRLMFPIWNEQGRVVGFSSRKVLKDDPGAKYINTGGKTPVFDKGRLLYAFSFARHAMHNFQSAILCEGQLDVMAMHRAGFENAVAPQGTAFTHEQATMIRRQTDRLFLALDSDRAGQNAMVRDIEIALPMGFDVKIIHFPGGKDPDELIRTQGADAVVGAVRSAVDFLEFLIDYYKNPPPEKSDDDDADEASPGEQAREALESHVAYDDSPAARSAVANAVVKTLALIDNEVKLNAYCTALAKNLGISETAVARQIKALRLEKGEQTPAEVPQRPMPVPKMGDRPDGAAQSSDMQRLAVIERALLRLVLEDEQSAKSIAYALDSGLLRDNPVANALSAILQMTLQGEWCHRFHVIQNMSHESMECDLAQFLVEQPLNFSSEKLARAVDESLFNFKDVFISREVAAALAAWKTAVSDEDMVFARQRYLDAQGRLRAHRKNRNISREQEMIKRTNRAIAANTSSQTPHENESKTNEEPLDEPPF